MSVAVRNGHDARSASGCYSVAVVDGVEKESELSKGEAVSRPARPDTGHCVDRRPHELSPKQ